MGELVRARESVGQDIPPPPELGEVRANLS